VSADTVESSSLLGRVRWWGVGFWLIVVLLLAPAVLLTWLRFAQPTGGRAVRLVSFAPYAVALYAALLPVFLVRLLLGGRGSRRWRLVPLAVVLALLVVHGWWLSPQFVGSRPRAAPGTDSVTVLTANMYRGRGDGSVLVSRAEVAEVDLLSVQEVTPGLLTMMERAGLNERLPYRVGEPRDGAEGTMMFSRYPIEDVSEIADAAQTSWKAAVALPSGPLEVLAVHATAPTYPSRWHGDHAAIRAAARGSDVVAGDFNATLDHRPMMLLEADGFRSVAELSNQGWQPTWPADGGLPLNYLGAPALVQIDHVLVGSGMTGTFSRRLRIPGTDHEAVLARVALARPTRS
jgi:endonuclease/exonuclease/phosphatase family metal-dependent hydrolase